MWVTVPTTPFVISQYLDLFWNSLYTYTNASMCYAYLPFGWSKLTLSGFADQIQEGGMHSIRKIRRLQASSLLLERQSRTFSSDRRATIGGIRQQLVGAHIVVMVP